MERAAAGGVSRFGADRLLLGPRTGAGSGAAITVGLEAVGVCVWAAEGREAVPDIDGLGMWVSYSWQLPFGAVLGGMSGAVLGPLQGWRPHSGHRPDVLH